MNRPKKTRHAHVTWPASHLAGLHGKPEWFSVKPRLVMKRGDPDIYSTPCKKPERGEERRNRHTDSRNQADVMGKNGK